LNQTLQELEYAVIESKAKTTASIFLTRRVTIGNLLTMADQQELFVIFFSRAAILGRQQVAFCALAIALSAVPLCAQKDAI
jgi:hypothetical protein